MTSALKAGASYFALIFALGFMLGVIRTLAFEPRLGELLPVLIELPVILAAAWFICGRLMRTFAIERVAERAAMGAVAFVLLIAAETIMAMTLFRRSGAEVIAAYGSSGNMIGLAGQVAFALFPLIRPPVRAA